MKSSHFEYYLRSTFAKNQKNLMKTEQKILWRQNKKSYEDGTKKFWMTPLRLIYRLYNWKAFVWIIPFFYVLIIEVRINVVLVIKEALYKYIIFVWGLEMGDRWCHSLIFFITFIYFLCMTIILYGFCVYELYLQ